MAHIEVFILKAFVSDMAYGPMEIKCTNKKIEVFMRAETESGKRLCDQLERTHHFSASLIEILITAHVSGINGLEY